MHLLVFLLQTSGRLLAIATFAGLLSAGLIAAVSRDGITCSPLMGCGLYRSGDRTIVPSQ